MALRGPPASDNAVVLLVTINLNEKMFGQITVFSRSERLFSRRGYAQTVQKALLNVRGGKQSPQNRED